MLDRKGWIILLLCGAALAVNIMLGSKERQERMVREAAEREKIEASRPAMEPDESQDATPEAGTDAPPVPAAEEQTVELRTNTSIYHFSSFGGGLKTVEMLRQQQVGDGGENVLINRHGKHVIGALTRGVDEYVDAVYEVASRSEREVVFKGVVDDGLQVTKRWTLVEDSEVGSGFRMELELTVTNGGEAPVSLGQFGLGLGTAAALYQREWDDQTGIFHRANDSYDFESMKWFKGGKRTTLEKDPGNLEYVGISNQFFTTIFTPATPYEARFWAKRKVVELPEGAGSGEKGGVAAAFSLPAETLAPQGGVKIVNFDVFCGPKRNMMLRKIDRELGPVMNYGWFGAISNILNRALNVIHSKIFVPISDKWSWGFAIVLLTILIRGAMWPLQNKSTRSMKRMSLLKEPVAALKEKYADDPQKMNQEMMKLYREYGINPLGGCLPLLVQIPIFFGFYRMLQYAVELRQAKFLWVQDLSQPDTLAVLPIFGGVPLNILPIVMAATMVLQMGLTPKTGDKMQTRIFMLMPLIFFFFCYNFASALALYWTTSNIFAIVQMLITQRLPEPELKKKKKKKAGWMERMQARAEEMQRNQKKRGGGGPPAGGASKPKKPRGPRTGG